MFNNNYMMENYPKNSLLRQLKDNGLTKDINESADEMSFDFSTENFEDSPFNLNSAKDDPIKKDAKIIGKHLNVLDNNLFDSPDYLNLEDDEISNQEKIKKLRELIKKTDEKIYMLEDSDNKGLSDKYKEDRENMLRVLNFLVEETRKTQKGEALIKHNLKLQLSRLESFIFKMCPPLYKSFLVRKALRKLRKLNDSANEICNREYSHHGEIDGKYNEFITCLSCANVINAKLTKKI